MGNMSLFLKSALSHTSVMWSSSVPAYTKVGAVTCILGYPSLQILPCTYSHDIWYNFGIQYELDLCITISHHTACAWSNIKLYISVFSLRPNPLDSSTGFSRKSGVSSRKSTGTRYGAAWVPKSPTCNRPVGLLIGVTLRLNPLDRCTGFSRKSGGTF